MLEGRVRGVSHFGGRAPRIFGVFFLLQGWRAAGDDDRFALLLRALALPRVRQTDSFDWDTNPHTPRLYFKPAAPLHLPRHNDLLGLHRLNVGMEKYYGAHPLSPGDPWRLSYSVGTLGVRMCITERLEEDVGE